MTPDEPARGRRDTRDAGAAASVRLAIPADAAAIARVHVRSWQATYRGIVPRAVLDRLSVERREAFWLEAITRSVDESIDGGERVWLAERAAPAAPAASPDGEVVGFASTGPARDADLPATSGELYAIYLVPEAWSQGIGRRLFAAAIDDLAVRHDPLVLWVLTDNARGRRFYEAAGWRPDGASRLLDFDGTPIEEIRFRRY